MASPTILSEMQQLVGTREVGFNRGAVVDKLNRTAGNAMGAPYCAATIYYCAVRSHCVSPLPSRPGLALNWRTSDSWTVQDVLSGSRPLKPDDLLIFRVGDTWRGHIVSVERVVSKSRVACISANSSCNGSGNDRDGDGICRKTYTIRPYSYYGPKFVSRPRYT